TQAQVEQRLAGWAQDLDRAADTTKARVAELAQRQKQLFSDAEVRLATDAERLAADSEEQRAAGHRLRAELDKTLDEVLARAGAARRLSRELDRAVEVFVREAEGVLAERLAHVGDAGAQRLETRLAEATKALERQRDERLATLDGRMVELEAEIRRRVEELGADADAERAVIEARLQELRRRLDSA